MTQSLILNVPSPVKHPILTGLTKKVGPRKGRAGVGGPKSSSSPNRQNVRPEVPNAKLGDEVSYLASTTALLGSSQLSGVCPGDFCAYNASSGDLANATAGGGGTSTDKMSKFRQKLVLAEQNDSRTRYVDTLTDSIPLT